MNAVKNLSVMVVVVVIHRYTQALVSGNFLPNAMTGSALELVDSNVGAALNHGDTVIARSDITLRDVDHVGPTDVDSVRVRASIRGRNLEVV